MTNKRSRRLASVLLVIFGFVVGALLAEIGLRIIGYSFPDFYMPDEARGYTLRPGVEGWYTKEGEAYVRINSDGWRDREHSKQKPANTIRVAVLGDSYAEALQVPFEQSFPAILQQGLQGCSAFPGKQIEVLNFGVSGYGTAQELLTLRDHVWQYSPDIVILTVTTSNDITDNSLQLRKRAQTPYFVYHNGQLVLDDSFRNLRSFKLRNSLAGELGSWIADHSRVVQAVTQGFRALRILSLTWKSRAKLAESAPGGEPSDKTESAAKWEELGTDNVVYLEPSEPVWNEAWRITEGIILMMRDEVRSRGARFVIVTLSNGPQVLPTPTAREGFIKRFGVKDLFYPDHRIEHLAKDKDIPIITLAPELQSYAEQHQVFLHGFGSDLGNGHWNATGNRVAGELIAQRLCDGAVLK